MRTITKNIYSFSELSEEAKRNAINNYEFNDFWESERIESYKKALPYYKLLKNIDGVINGSRLYTFIQNNIISDFIEPNYINKQQDGKINNCYYSHKYNCTKKRLSKVFKTNNLNNCPLTGVCYDFDFLQPIIDFMENPTSKIDNTDLQIPSYDSVFQKDYYTSDEFIIEELEDNDSEFYEDGTLI